MGSTAFLHQKLGVLNLRTSEANVEKGPRLQKTFTRFSSEKVLQHINK